MKEKRRKTTFQFFPNWVQTFLLCFFANHHRFICVCLVICYFSVPFRYWLQQRKSKPIPSFLAFFRTHLLLFKRFSTWQKKSIIFFTFFLAMRVCKSQASQELAPHLVEKSGKQARKLQKEPKKIFLLPSFFLPFLLRGSQFSERRGKQSS